MNGALPSDRQQSLAAFVIGSTFDKVPASFVARLKQSVLDSLACGIYGSRTPWASIVARHSTGQGSGTCRVWGHATKTVGSAAAVMANATMIHSFELDDVHSGSRSHPGSVTIPLGFALAEETATPISGRTFLESLAVGYETLVRVGAAQGVSSFNRGWHPTGTAGVLGAAATAARLLKLDVSQCAHAFGIAGTMPCGLMAAQYGAMVKRLFAGHAAWAGLLSASLARDGFTGIGDVFDAEYGGYLKALSDDVQLGPLTDRLGEHWDAASIGYKLFSCVGTNHTALQALSDLRREADFTAQDVERIEIKTSEYQVLHSGWTYSPSTVMAAQMNLQYCAAVLLLEGDVFVDQFRDELLADHNVLEMARRVVIESDPTQDHKDRKAQVKVRLKDGRLLEASCSAAKGHPLNPPEWSDITQKFHGLAGKFLDRSTCDEIVETVDKLEELKDLRTLARLMEFQA